MNQETLTGTQVGILIDLSSPLNIEQRLPNIPNPAEECGNSEISSTETKLETLVEPDEKTNLVNMSVQGKECTNQESENSRNQSFKWSEDIPLVENEQFDFDLSLSPNGANRVDSNDEEDEVFFGPVNHREKCVRVKKDIESKSLKPLSPLTNEQYAELFKEATGLVMDLQQNGDPVKEKKTSGETEQFISKTLESLKLTSLYDSSPETTVDCSNKTAISESQCFKREQKKDIRSPRRQTYIITKNVNPISELPKASECVSRLKPAGAVAFKAKGAVQKSVPRPSMKAKNPKGSVTASKQSFAKKRQELSKSNVSTLSVKTSPPKRVRKSSSQCSEDGISDTSSITSDISETSTSSIPVPGKKRSLPVPSKLMKSGLAAPTKIVNGHKGPSNKPTLMKPGTFQRRTLIVNRSQKGETTSKTQQQPLKATLSLKSTKKTTPVSKMQPAAKDPRKTPSSNLSVAKSSQVRKGTPRGTLMSTPVFQEKRVVPKRIITSSSKTDPKQITRSTSPYSASSLKATPATPSISNHKPSVSTTGSARRRSGIPTPMKSSTKSRVFSFNNVAPPSPLPMRISQSSMSSSSVSDSPIFPKVMPKIPEYASTQEQSASPACTQVVDKFTEKRIHKEDCIAPNDAKPQQLQCDKTIEKPSPAAKTAVLIDLNDSKTSAVSSSTANLINFADTPEPKMNLPVSEKENLLIVI
ncbi:G2 and S phase-expressed protein 1-like isoform X2 [Anneissia japonica]|uniref:G2 and S phase-expressed protein 1-like isoform X2 n=1 Tax=Anneissia japonica TaxID=1529436 RepID=UPI001425AAA8|nr:G2 and S phase-expressed protein 1-like isoform X2 [Anneissia japonica]